MKGAAAQALFMLPAARGFHGKKKRERAQLCVLPVRPLTKPANAKISMKDEKPAEIFACIVSCSCKMRSLTSK